MSTILLLGDLHLADRPPSSCTDTYLDDLFTLLEQTVTLARAKNYAAVVQAGDFFHSKIPARTSHRLIQRSIELIKQYPCPFYIVMGNHDMAHDRAESVSDTQPLGVLLRTCAYPLVGWSDNHSEYSLPVYGIPWLQVWNDRDSTGGPSPYACNTITTALGDWHSRWDGSVPALIVTHAPFYRPGTELEFEHFPTDVFADLMGNHGWVYYGHVHEPAGEFLVNGVRFCNNGALSRGSLHEYNLTREIVATEWDTVTGRFTRIPLDAKPPEQVFKLAEAAEKKQAQVDLDQFLASIGEASIEITSIESVMEHVRSLRLDHDTEQLIVELLHSATR